MKHERRPRGRQRQQHAARVNRVRATHAQCDDVEQQRERKGGHARYDKEQRARPETAGGQAETSENEARGVHARIGDTSGQESAIPRRRERQENSVVLEMNGRVAMGRKWEIERLDARKDGRARRLGRIKLPRHKVLQAQNVARHDFLRLKEFICGQRNRIVNSVKRLIV